MDTLTTALRLLANNIDCEDGVATTVILQAAGEIDRLRERLDELRSAADQADVEYRAEIDTLRLTDAEREAVRFCGELCRMGERPDLDATLRGLLSRLSPLSGTGQ